jgi:hypothetical protein
MYSTRPSRLRHPRSHNASSISNHLPVEAEPVLCPNASVPIRTYCLDPL